MGRGKTAASIKGQASVSKWFWYCLPLHLKTGPIADILVVEYCTSMTHKSQQYYGPTASLEASKSSEVYQGLSGNTSSKWSLQTMKEAFRSMKKFTRKALPIVLNGRRCISRPDTGSEKNIMTEEFAKEHGISVQRLESDEDTF